jgi:hypothetical protein
MRIRPLISIALLLVASRLLADDWPQFRGPKRDGLSAETGLLKSWPKSGPKLVWSFKNAGLGFSSYSVVGNTFYTLGSRDNDEIILALDALKGTELWTVKLGPIFTSEENVQWGDGPRSTPTIDGKRLYALGAQGELVCLDISAAKPKEVWRKNLITDFGGVMMTGWGYSESPLVDGKLLLVTPGGNGGTVAALDKEAGTVVWRTTDIKHAAAYTSVMAADINGQRQYIQTSYEPDPDGNDKNDGSFINGFAAKGGKLLWSQKIFKGYEYLIASNPLIKDSLVYHSAGDHIAACHLFEIGKDNKLTDKYSKASQKIMKNNHGGVVRVGDHVYGYSDNRGWVCQDFASGKVAWEERNDLECFGSGSLMAADGMLYCVSDKGTVGLVEASPKGFELAGSVQMPELSKFPKTRKTSTSSKVWSYPVVANGHLYVRDSEFIYCFDVRDKK